MSERAHELSASPAAEPVAEALSASFEIFYETEHDALFGSLYLMTGDRHESEELMQDAFLKVWERWDLVQGLDSPTGYLYRTGMNAFRMRYRRTAVAARKLVGVVNRRDPFEAVDARDEVDRALAGLRPRQRAALVLTELLDFSSEEAGRILGVKAGTVRALASQGRAAIRHLAGGTR